MKESCAEKIAREIIRTVNVQLNVPYSYGGQDYLSAEEAITLILLKHIKK